MFPESFATQYLQTDSESYDGMLCIDDKNYVLWRNGELTKHGSSLRGKHLPIIADKFVEALCIALFKDESPEDILRDFGAMIEDIPLNQFAMTISLAKRPYDYAETSLYFKLTSYIKRKGVNVVSGATIGYVKTVNGYVPIMFLKNTRQIDYKYYKGRLAALASRILTPIWCTVSPDPKLNRKTMNGVKKACMKYLLGMQGKYKIEKMEQIKLA